MYNEKNQELSTGTYKVVPYARIQNQRPKNFNIAIHVGIQQNMFILEFFRN